MRARSIPRTNRRPSGLLAVLCLTALGSSAPATAIAQDAIVHTFERVKLSDAFVAEGAALGDLNGDGHADVIAGPWWYEGPAFEVRRPLTEARTFPIERYSDSFFAWVDDIDGDGRQDVLIVGFPGQEAAWLRNPGPEGHDRPWPRHVALAGVDNESPAFVDLTGDGRRELVCQRGGYFGFAAPDRAHPERPWVFRAISPKVAGGAFTHGLGVGDVNGDGRADLVEKTGWWEQPPSLEGDPVWTHHPFAFAERGGAQMLVYDVNGDGRADVITSLDAHGHGLAWFEQVDAPGAGGAEGAEGAEASRAITFRRHTILGSTPDESLHGLVVSQMHALALADVDGDGLLDLVTGKRYWAHGGRDPGANDAAVVYWFRIERRAGSVVFVPYLVDDASGVGTQVTTGDANGDGLVDVVTSNKLGTFVHLQARRAVDADAWANAQPREQRPRTAGLAPAAAAAHMTAPPGFHVDLVAGEPDVHQPVAFTIDDRGRLWVAEAYTYPRRAPEGKGKDRILILEDSTGDGVFDTRKVFIEGLNLVSGIEVGFGGVWVGAAPYLLFVPDRDGDDIPDGPPIVELDGWGYQDTHETLNAFIWGPDGWLYGCHGVFTHSRVGRPGTADADRVPINAGVWRYHPVNKRFEVFAWGTSNPWGLDFDDRGQAFATACVIPHLFHIAQGGRYHRQAGPHFDRYVYEDIKTIADHTHYAGQAYDKSASTDAAGGGHAHCGLSIYLGDAFPKSYRGALLFHNIHGNRVNHDVVERRGSGFVARHRPDFLQANDRWFMGVNLRYGPWGELYMIDWSDAQACHHTEPARWDRSNGRIFRVTYRGPGAAPAPGAGARRVSLRDEPDARLVDMQLEKNDWTVRTARRLLQERAVRAGGAPIETRRSLLAMAVAHGDETRRLRGMWALDAVGGMNSMIALGLLDSERAYVRAWMVQLACNLRLPSADLLARFAEMAAKDPSPVVRLYLASALQRLPLDARWPIARNLVRRAADAVDPNLPLMLWYGVEPLVTHDPGRALELAWTSMIPKVTRFIVRRAASSVPGLEKAFGALSATDDLERQRLILEEVQIALAGRAHVAAPPTWGAAVERLAAVKDPGVREQLEDLAVLFGDRQSFPVLRAALADREVDLARRRRAFDVLTGARDPELAPALMGLLDEEPLRALAARALAAYDDAAIAGALIERYPRFDAATRQSAIDTLAARPPSALALLDAIAADRVPRREVSAYTVRHLTRLGDETVSARLAAVWGKVGAPDEDAAERIAALSAQLDKATLAAADLGRGRILAEASCLTCHRLFGQGSIIGPDLTGSNRGDLGYLLENVVAPSAVVGRAYEMRWVTLHDGRIVSGFVVAEGDDTLDLQTQLGVVRLLRSEIRSVRTSTLSMMPDGLLDTLAPAEVRDLVAYLQSPVQVARPRPGPRLDPATGRAPGALEGEALEVVRKSRGDARAQDMTGFPADRWSAGSHLWWTGGRPGDQLVLALPVEAAGRYEVEVVLTKARDYGIVQLSLDGEPIGPEIDLFHETGVVTTGVLSLGTLDLAAGRRELAIELRGAHPRAIKAYMAGLDFVSLRPD